MKHFNKHILEAIQRGVQLALDDYEDNASISTKHNIVKSGNIIDNVLDSIYDKISKGDRVTTDDMESVLKFYKNSARNAKCIVNDKKQLNNIIQTCLQVSNEIDLNWIDVRNIKDFTRLFQKLKNVIIDCSEWDTNHVKKFNYVFAFSQKTVAIKANNWTFDSAEELDGMFYGCKAKIDIDNEYWNTDKVKAMRNMFSGCNSELLYYANRLDISSCRDFNSMFKSTKYVISSKTQSPIIDLSEWRISHQCDTDYMFEKSNIPQNLQPKFVNDKTYSFTPQSKIGNKIDKRKAMQDFKAAINTFIDQTKCKKLNGLVSTYGDLIYSGRIIFPDGSLGDFQFNIENGKCDIVFYNKDGLSINGYDLEKLINIVNSMFK